MNNQGEITRMGASIVIRSDAGAWSIDPLSPFYRGAEILLAYFGDFGPGLEKLTSDIERVGVRRVS